MRAILKNLLLRVICDYRINWIVATAAKTSETTIVLTEGLNLVRVDDQVAIAIDASPTKQFRKASGYFRSGLRGYALMAGSQPVCVTHFATFEQYDRHGTWPMQQVDLALMDITTEERFRGKGLAALLVSSASRALHSIIQPHRIIAFVWWSNTPSLRAFEKAGWQRIGFSIEILVGKNWYSLHLPLPHLSRT